MAGEPFDLASTVNLLLHCLPLLRTGNAPAKAAYLHVLPAVLRRSTETGQCLPACQQVLSYALIHPAISGDELMPLNAWQPQLNDDMPPRCSFVTPRVCADDVINGPTTSPSDRVSNGMTNPAHRDLSTARSLPVGLLHDTSLSSVVGAGASSRPSRTSAAAAAAVATTAGGTVYLQHSSPPPGLPRALTPPRRSELTFSFYYSATVLLICYIFMSFVLSARIERSQVRLPAGAFPGWVA